MMKMMFKLVLKQVIMLRNQANDLVCNVCIQVSPPLFMVEGFVIMHFQIVSIGLISESYVKLP